MSQVQESTSLEISKTAGVSGGNACIGGTRIPIWLLVSFRKRGASDDELLEFYPQLTKEHLTLAWDYYESHQEEIQEELREQNDE